MEHAADLIMFIPVGTTIADGEKLDRPKVKPEDIVNVKLNKLLHHTKPPGERFPIRASHKDPHPAEISSLYGFFEKKQDELKGKSLKLILLHSPKEGKACAEGIRKLIKVERYLSNKPTDSTLEVVLKELAHLDPKDAQEFPKALSALTKIISDGIRGFDGEIYINITGGYKALLPYLTMIGTSLAGVKIFYLFQDAPEIIMLPTYPLAFDLLEWRDWRGLLLPFTMDVGLNDSQKMELTNALEGTKAAGLVQQESPYGLSEIGRVMYDRYEAEKGAAISEYGTGSLLLGGFEDAEYAEYLKTKCIPRWRHLSVGDHIPETVEHGRGHVQRLLELTQQLIIAADLKLSDEQLFVLIASIWLHDLGHSGDYFCFEGSKGLIQDPCKPCSEEQVSVYDKPEWVRLYHHFLTYELLKTEKQFLFQNEDRPEKINKALLRSVQLACLYHRKKMPVETEGTYKNKIGAKEVRIAKGFRVFTGSDVVPEFPLVAALLRFLDGAENQEERAGGKEYSEVSQWVLERQIDFGEKNPDSSGTNVAFKKNQKGHFKKHRWIQHVFFVKEHSASLSPDGIFGENEDSGLVGAYMIANREAPEYERDELIAKVINPFLEEFLLVQKLLPFRLALFLCEPDDKGGVERYHVIREPDFEKKPEEWDFTTSLV